MFNDFSNDIFVLESIKVLICLFIWYSDSIYKMSPYFVLVD